MTQTSPHRVFFTGGNKAGSWEIRGRQIGEMRANWKSSHTFTDEDIANYDIFVFVKKANPEHIQKLKEMGKVVIYDVVDSWAQPSEGLTHTDVAAARKLFTEKWKVLSPHAFIFPNYSMYADFRNQVPNSTYIYHHFRPGLEPIEIREKPLKVGYEGNANYLGHWQPSIERLCAKHGLEFVVNPETITGLDIGFIARGGDHDNFLSNRYKSNVKLANMYGAGIPCLASDKELSCHETDTGDVLFFSNEAELEKQFERILDFETRKTIQRNFLKVRPAYEIEAITRVYETFFQECSRRRALRLM